MSIPERLYRLSKAYLGQVRSRIDAELADAERELDAGKDPAMPDREDTSPEAMMRRAEARIASARREMEAQAQLQGQAASGATGTSAASGGTATAAKPGVKAASEETDPNASDYRIMGVPVGSEFAVVQTAYEKLARRCDPRRFPDGSAEQTEAERILERVNAAYERLKKRLDPMQSRFNNLELE